MRIDAEKDFHHLTGAETVRWLNEEWATRRWHGLTRVRLIHGNGAVLYKVVRDWADDHGIPWTTELNNPGVTILHPARRRTAPIRPTTLPAKLRTSLSSSASSTKPTGPTQNEEEIKQQMEAEFDRLGIEEPRNLLRRKRG